MISIIDAISIRLNETFGDDYTIYLESVEQNLQTPCFFIQPLASMGNAMIDYRVYRSHSFMIDFIPNDITGHRAQFAEVTDKLFDSFESLILEDGTFLPAFNRRVDVTDDVLHFIVEFKFYGYKDVPEEDKLETMNMSVI